MDVNQFRPETDISGLTNPELLLVHTQVHSYWKEIEEYGREVNGWDRNSLIKVHEEIRSKLEDRGLPHQNLNGLDDETVVHEKKVEFEAVKPEFEQIEGSFVDLEDWL